VQASLDGPVVSVVVDAHRDLPDPIAHDRPVPMLLTQLQRDPELTVRVSAIRALEKICSDPGKPPQCAELPVELERAIAQDNGRLVRTVALQTLERLRPPPKTE
jgi:HEAT repeat protein